MSFSKNEEYFDYPIINMETSADEYFDYPITNMLYAKYITRYIKPLLQNEHTDTHYYHKFRPYFDKNRLLDLPLADEINLTLMENALELCEIYWFRYHIQRYCEFYGRYDIKEKVMANVIQSIYDSGIVYKGVYELDEKIYNDLKKEYLKISREDLEKIAFDVLKSSYIVN